MKNIVSRVPAERAAYVSIRERILSGALPPGARLVAEDVAAELSVSRTPVREAIRQLDAEGLLVIRPNRGAVVASFSPDEVLDLFEIRAALEALAARRACERWDDDSGDRLHLALRRLARTPAGHAEYMRVHEDFHAVICKQAGSDRLTAETERLRAAVERYLRLYFTRHETDAGTYDDHLRVLEAVESRDPARAEACMKQHIMQTAIDLVAGLRGGSAPSSAGASS